MGASPAPAGGALSEAQKSELKEACQEFEAFFWNSMLEVSKFGESTGDAPMLGNMNAGNMRSELSRFLSRTGSLGISDVIYRSLVLKSEGKSNEDR